MTMITKKSTIIKSKVMIKEVKKLIWNIRTIETLEKDRTYKTFTYNLPGYYL